MSRWVDTKELQGTAEVTDKPQCWINADLGRRRAATKSLAMSILKTERDSTGTTYGNTEAEIFISVRRVDLPHLATHENYEAGDELANENFILKLHPQFVLDFFEIDS